MPHGGFGERFVCEPVPRGPEALFTFGRGPDVASRRRLAAELTSSLPKLARRSASFCPKAEAPLLSVFTIKTRARTTQSRTRPARDTPCQVVPKPGAFASLRPRKSLVASHQRETRTERLRTFDRNRAPVAGRCPCRSSSFPRKRGETSKNDARCTQSHSLRRAPATACCKDNGHSLSLSGWSAPAETRATQRPKPWRPEPTRPNTDAVATIARRSSTCDSPKTHHPSKLEQLLGHLRLDSPAKVGRFAAVTAPCGAAFAGGANHRTPRARSAFPQAPSR